MAVKKYKTAETQLTFSMFHDTIPASGVNAERRDAVTETKTAPPKSDTEPMTADSDSDVAAGNGKPDRRLHGKSFIYLTLEDAEKAVRNIDEHERRMSKASFARALQHPEPKGRFLHKLSALEDYKLVTVKGDYVELTDLAVEMLYGGTEQARARARAQAFLSYDMFKRTFVECPKNQDHQMSYLLDFVRVTLKIVNDTATYIRRFLESAAYAGLLEGEPNPKAATIRLRPALVAPSNGEAVAEGPARAAEDQWVLVAPNEVASVLDGLGLTPYQNRADVTQRSAGDVTISMADGKITIEVRRPTRVTIRPTNTLSDITEIIKALQSKGFKA